MSCVSVCTQWGQSWWPTGPMLRFPQTLIGAGAGLPERWVRVAPATQAAGPERCVVCSGDVAPGQALCGTCKGLSRPDVEARQLYISEQARRRQPKPTPAVSSTLVFTSEPDLGFIFLSPA